MKRFRLKTVLALGVVLATAVVAWAFYATTGTGTGSGGTTGSLTAATISVPATSSGSHAITWTQQATLSNASQESQITYTVERKVDAGSFAPVASGPCSGDLPHGTTNCTDTVGADGTYTYRVVATYHSWTATSNEASVEVDVGGGDTTPPTVQSINRADGNPTNAGSVSWTVTFSENVSGVNAADFDLVPSSVGGTPAITNVTGSDDTYTVTASTGTGDGSLGLDLDDDDSIEDGAGNKLGGTGTSGAGDGSFTGEVYTFDRTAPTVQSIARADGNPTNAGSVSWTVTFSENVSGVDAADFDLVPTGLGGTPAITNVTGNNATYTVTASTGSGSGTLGLDLDDDDSIEDAVTNKLGGTGADNGDFTGQVYTIDRTAPTVQSIDRADGNPTNAGSVSWTVTFSENVTGVDAADFDLVPSGLGGTPAITNVTGNNATYTVTASTGSGSGSLGLDLDDDDSIQDAVTNKLGGTGADNGDFSGQVYTIDRTAPTVQSIDRADGNPTNAGSVSWTVTFSENVSGVNAADFDLVPSGLGGTPAITNVTGSNATYTVTASTGSGQGTLGLDLDDDDSIEDAVTNKLGGTGADNGDFTGQVYTIDRNAPTVQSINRASADPTNATSVQWTVTFSESVSGVGTGDFAVAQSGGVSGASVSTVTPAGPADTYTVTANTGSNSGTLGLNLVDDDSIVDGVGNPLGGTGAGNGSFTGQTYTIDKTAPQLQTLEMFDNNGNGKVDRVVATFNETLVSSTNNGPWTLNNTPSGGTKGALSTSGSTATLLITEGGGAQNTAVGSFTVALAQNATGIRDALDNRSSFSAQAPTDKASPIVISVNRADPDPSNASTVQWTATFTESVTGVDTADFAVAQGGGLSGASVTGVSGSGATRTVTANTGSGNGTLGLNLVDNDTIQDNIGAPNKLGGTGTGNGDFTGQVYTIDKTTPQLQTLEMFDNNGNGKVDRVVATFDETLVSTTNAAPWTLNNVPSGGNKGTLSTSGATATLLINEGGGAPNTAVGTFTVALAQSATGIRDAADNRSSFVATAPTDKAAPIVVSIDRASGTNPTNAASVPFTATFSESVTGVDSGDFTVPVTGTVSGASVTTVSGSGATRTVDVNTGTGDGTIGLNLVDDDSIEDTAASPNKLGGTGAGNGSFTGQTYSIDKTAPQLVTLEMKDNDTDGLVDRVVATFDDTLVSTTNAAPWTLTNVPSGGTKSTLSTTGSTATLLITEGGGARDTSVGSFTVALAQNATGIRDAVGNQSSFATQAPTDDASPVPTALVDTNGTNDGRFEATDTATMTFSENVTNSAATPMSVVLADPAGNNPDTLSAPGFMQGTNSLGNTGAVDYMTGNNVSATFGTSTLSQPALNQVRVTLSACTAGTCANVSPGASAATPVVVIPATTIEDADDNAAVQNSAMQTVSIRLF